MRGRWFQTTASALLAVIVLTAASTDAQAVYECGGIQDTCVCGQANFCICCTNSTYGTDHGNCVWYAWHKACCEWGVGLQWCTNAETWDGYATSNGYTLLTTPCEDTIFVCEMNTSHCGSGGYGHVGWVNTVYPDGTIDVEEQGCYSWYGVQTRNFNASAASPTMHYIYEPGVTSCPQCDCTPGATETDPNCGNCGSRTRTCGGDCQWGSWSSCAGEGVCAQGATQGCGNCGGSQTCQSDCQWGVCQETCPDASVPQPDASTPQPDGATTTPDGATPQPDSGTNPLPDGATPQPDGGGIRPGLVQGGCHCQSGSGAGFPAGLALFGVLALLLIRRRRRRS